MTVQSAIHELHVRVAKPIKEWLSRKEAALYLEQINCPITAKTLANMAANGNAGHGPTFTRNGWKMVQYRRADLEIWAKQRRTEIRSR